MNNNILTNILKHTFNYCTPHLMYEDIMILIIIFYACFVGGGGHQEVSGEDEECC